MEEASEFRHSCINNIPSAIYASWQTGYFWYWKNAQTYRCGDCALQREPISRQLECKKTARKHLSMSVYAQNISPLAHRSRQLLEHCLGVFPANARVCDAHAVLQALLALFRYFLVAYRFESA